MDDSAESHAQRDGVDEQSRPYRDVPLLPRQVFAYAETIGSTFGSRVVEARCRDCHADMLEAWSREFTFS